MKIYINRFVKKECNMTQIVMVWNIFLPKYFLWNKSWCLPNNVYTTHASILSITRLLGRPPPQMYPPVALIQYKICLNQISIQGSTGLNKAAQTFSNKFQLSIEYFWSTNISSHNLSWEYVLSQTYFIMYNNDKNEQLVFDIIIWITLWNFGSFNDHSGSILLIIYPLTNMQNMEVIWYGLFELKSKEWKNCIRFFCSFFGGSGQNSVLNPGVPKVS